MFYSLFPGHGEIKNLIFKQQMSVLFTWDLNLCLGLSLFRMLGLSPCRYQIDVHSNDWRATWEACKVHFLRGNWAWWQCPICTGVLTYEHISQSLVKGWISSGVSSWQHQFLLPTAGCPELSAGCASPPLWQHDRSPAGECSLRRLPTWLGREEGDDYCWRTFHQQSILKWKTKTQITKEESTTCK